MKFDVSHIGAINLVLENSLGLHSMELDEGLMHQIFFREEAGHVPTPPDSTCVIGNTLAAWLAAAVSDETASLLIECDNYMTAPWMFTEIVGPTMDYAVEKTGANRAALDDKIRWAAPSAGCPEVDTASMRQMIETSFQQ